MRVLYAIQGTGNGHLSRARALVPELLRHDIHLDLLVSGIQSDIPLPFPVKYQYHGVSFIFGKQGGVDLWETYRQTQTFRVQKEIRNLPVSDYDLVLNDFEPISAWACKWKGVPCIGVSHQAAVLCEAAPKPEKIDLLGQLILKRYAPVTAQFGFHFQAYAPGIYTPVIRQGIRQAVVTDKGHFTVYLPAYSDTRILSVLSQFPNIQWHVFSKHGKQSYQKGRIHVQPVSNEAFITSITQCSGVLCAAGFETPSEALFMGKKLCVVPMRNQYEQQCNAAALAEMGVLVLDRLDDTALRSLHAWLQAEPLPRMEYPDVAPVVVDRILETQVSQAV